MTLKRTLILALVLCCTACGFFEYGDQASFRLPVPDSNAGAPPKIVDVRNQHALDELTADIGKKRAIFIGEIHDRLEHHQNQLRVIKSLYAQNPDLAIGVEYFQQPFQSYLNDYIAGRIDEQQMRLVACPSQRGQED